MTIGVLGDMHGNLEAMSAVAEQLVAAGVEQLLCVGDIVGYNADPNECVSLARALEVQSVAGNHDLVAAGLLGTEGCAPKAAHALRRTRQQLSAEATRYLERLPLHLHGDGFLVQHGGLDNPRRYVRGEQEAAQEARRVRARFPRATICFFGHTHEQRAFEADSDGARRRRVDQPLWLDPQRLYLINPGSVDAARKRGHDLAQYAIYDPARRLVSFFEVPYRHQAAERKARAAGYRLAPQDRWLARAAATARGLVASAAQLLP